MFRPRIWRQYLAPAAVDMAERTNDPMLWYLLHTPKFEENQAAYEPKKVRTDEEVLKWMGFEL